MIYSDLSILLITIPLGLLVGIATGSVGQTANALILPLLYIMWEEHILVSIGASLLIDVINTAILFVIYGKNKNIKYGVAILLGSIGAASSLLGSYISFNYLISLGGALKILIIIILMISAAIFIRRAFKKRPNIDEIQAKLDAMSLKDFISSNKIKSIFIILVAVIYGFLAGLLGVGGGFVMALLLILLFKMKTIKATGTGILYMLIMVSVAEIPYIATYPLEISYWGLLFGISAICGTILSSLIAHRISEKKLNLFAGSVLIIFIIIIIIQQIFL
ncbi:MAG: TSUP family transporter [Candidatus Lokiarchaeota archaeon]|nr:TSUP family transporter [Candidatus Lokiarchaeota archaeon]